jgi:hypothetical protein
MKTLRMLSAQPALDYYAWQIEVCIHNFASLGYKNIDIVAGYQDEIPESWNKLYQTYSDIARFFFYKDTMGDCNYPPAIQAHLLQKHFKKHPDLTNDAFFFHDADFVFTKYMDFTPYLQDNTWYFSDTISYIGYDYIMSKGEEVLDAMCSQVGISKKLIEFNKNNSGGAQKLMKNLTSHYWRKVEQDSKDLYNLLTKMQHVRKEGDPNGIQAWTASMWAELWNAWFFGHHVEVPKEFDFAWATCPSDRWDELYFFHNAGVVNSTQGMFHKASYMDNIPFETDLQLDPNRCSYRYYEMIKSIKSCLV